jgi:hypothetical protein
MIKADGDSAEAMAQRMQFCHGGLSSLDCRFVCTSHITTRLLPSQQILSEQEGHCHLQNTANSSSQQE